MTKNMADPDSDLDGEATLMHAVRPLQEHLQGVLAAFDRVPNAELKDMVVAVERLSWQVFSAQTLLAAEVDARIMRKPNAGSLTDEYGCGSGREFLQRCTLMSRREAGSRIKLGNLLLRDVSLNGERLGAELPYLGAAVAAGAISPQATKLIAGVLGRVFLQDTMKRDEAERALVEAATGIDLGAGTLKDPAAKEEEAAAAGVNYFDLLAEYAEDGLLDPLPPVGADGRDNNKDNDNDDDVDEGAERDETEKGHLGAASPALAQDADDLKVLVDEWKQVLNQVGTTLDEKEALFRRGVTLGQPKDGLVPVRGHLLPEVAAVLSNEIDAIISPRNNNGSGTSDTSVRDVESVLTDTEWRSPAQKRHDALAAIVNMAASASEMPEHGGMPVTVLIETTEEALRAGGASWAHGPSSHTTLLTPQATWYATCTGAVQCYAKNAEGGLVALGTKQRVYNANQRRAIIARDGGCIIPGCSTPPAWCEIHHVHPHGEGGKTHTDNGVALCWYHHRTLDTNGWQIRMRSGAPEIKPPRWIDPNREWRRPKPPHKTPTRAAPGMVARG